MSASPLLASFRPFSAVVSSLRWCGRCRVCFIVALLCAFVRVVRSVFAGMVCICARVVRAAVRSGRFRLQWWRGGVVAVSGSAGVAGQKARARENYTPPLSVPQEIFGVDETAHVFKKFMCRRGPHFRGFVCCCGPRFSKKYGPFVPALIFRGFLKHLS